MAKPTFILVGADKGGVGKTTLSRTIIEYFNALNLPVRAFDTETPYGALQRYHPDCTELVDIFSTIDQRKIFEPDSDAPSITLVDFRAGTFLQTLATLKDIGILAQAEDGHFDILLMHLVAPTVVSLGEQLDVAEFKTSCDHFVVQAHAGKSVFFEEQKDVVRKYIGDVRPERIIKVPTINQMAMEAVDITGSHFFDFATDVDTDLKGPQKSLVLRGYVKTWLSALWDEFDRVGLRDVALQNLNFQPKLEQV